MAIEQKNEHSRKQSGHSHPNGDNSVVQYEPTIIGNCYSILKIKQVMHSVANVNLNVLISGETGTGKELIARGLHYYSERKGKRFMKVNCAALPNELVESELFGYEKGAFTGADGRKYGKFELANEGSVFLDEISEISPPIQAKLLQVLQDQRFHRIGGNDDIITNARVIAATNRDLEVEIEKGTFRGDLYYRLNTINIVLPPLRERKGDIPVLVDYFIQGMPILQEKIIFPDSLMELFHVYHWPGNVRELENYVKRFALLGNADQIRAEISERINRINGKASVKETNSKDAVSQDPLSQQARQTNESGPGAGGLERPFPTLKEVREKAILQAEREAIEKALRLTHWNRKEAAEMLQISYRSMFYKLKAMDLKPY